jgi:hypothetical protein
MQTSRSSSIARIIVLMAMLAFVLTTRAVCAEPWTRAYSSGGEVRVDPRTNRATIVRNGVERQLWDGVHQLDNGSTITVRAGQVVPTREILDSRQPAPPEVIERPPADRWTGVPIFRQSPCEKLEQRTCGRNNACAESDACSMSRQLLDFENQERAASRLHNRMTRASGECLEADVADPLFATCAR